MCDNLCYMVGERYDPTSAKLLPAVFSSLEKATNWIETIYTVLFNVEFDTEWEIIAPGIYERKGTIKVFTKKAPIVCWVMETKIDSPSL